MPELTNDYIIGRWVEVIRPLAARPEDFDIRDIAHSLAHKVRWNGFAPFAYTIAQHSVLCASKVPQEHRLEALLHDRSEAYLNDMVRPLRKLIPDFVTIEAKMDAVSAQKFGVPTTMSPEVREADDRMLVTEARQFFSHHKNRWWEGPGFPPPYHDIRIEAWSHAKAYRAFMTIYEALAGRQ